MMSLARVAKVDAVGTFVPLEDDGLSRHASVLIGHPDRRPKLRGLASPIWPGAHILKRVGVGRGLTHAEIQAIATGYLSYRRRLSRTWLVPRLHEVMCHETDGEWQLWILEDYVRGESLLAVSSRSRYSREERIRTYAQLVEYITKQDIGRYSVMVGEYRLPMMPVGVDLKPSNLLIGSGTGQPVLIDDFPPLLLDHQGRVRYLWPKLHTFAEKKLQVVCFTRAGVATRLVRLLQMGMADHNTQDRLAVEFLIAARLVGMTEPELCFLEGEVAGGYPVFDRLYPR